VGLSALYEQQLALNFGFIPLPSFEDRYYLLLDCYVEGLLIITKFISYSLKGESHNTLASKLKVLAYRTYFCRASKRLPSSQHVHKVNLSNKSIINHSISPIVACKNKSGCGSLALWMQGMILLSPIIMKASIHYLCMP
jgi:hypothetical protein